MISCVRTALISLSLILEASMASAGARATQSTGLMTVSLKENPGPRVTSSVRSNAGTALDRVADAVDGAESSHGEDVAMWRPDPSGPQGPMQVTEAAAADVGGGDRFDAMQNRAIGRSYLAQLYWRYKNWPDAIAAYNWGMGNVDAWRKAGRPPDKFLIGVAAYLRRVLHDSGLCDGSPRASMRQNSVRKQSRSARPGGETDAETETDAYSRATCADLDAWGGASDGRERRLFAPVGFYSKLENAMRLALRNESASPRSIPTGEERASAFASIGTERP